MTEQDILTLIERIEQERQHAATTIHAQIGSWHISDLRMASQIAALRQLLPQPAADPAPPVPQEVK